MKSFVINLKRRTDRKNKIKKLFNDCNFSNYEFYEAVDGSTLTNNEEIYNLFKGNDFGWRKGVIGCALSHYNLWKQLLNHSDEYYCIFEDDIDILENYQDLAINLDKCITFLSANKEIDLLFLGYSMYKHLRKQFREIYDIGDGKLKFEKYASNLYIGGFFGYIINKNFAKKMVDYINLNGIRHGIDYLIKLNKNLTVYECKPLFIQTDWVDNINSKIDSDIQKDFSSINPTNHPSYIVSIKGNNYIYYPGLDAGGNDIAHLSGIRLEDIASKAEEYSNCKGFNSLGFLKHTIGEIKKSPYISDQQGLYVKITKK